MDRRTCLTGAVSVAAAAALPTFEYETETFREAQRLGIIGPPLRIRLTMRIMSAPWDIKLGDCLSGSGLRDCVIVGIGDRDAAGVDGREAGGVPEPEIHDPVAIARVYTKTWSSKSDRGKRCRSKS